MWGFKWWIIHNNISLSLQLGADNRIGLLVLGGRCDSQGVQLSKDHPANCLEGDVLQVRIELLLYFGCIGRWHTDFVDLLQGDFVVPNVARKVGELLNP